MKQATPIVAKKKKQFKNKQTPHSCTNRTADAVCIYRFCCEFFAIPYVYICAPCYSWCHTAKTRILRKFSSVWLFGTNIGDLRTSLTILFVWPMRFITELAALHALYSLNHALWHSRCSVAIFLNDPQKQHFVANKLINTPKIIVAYFIVVYLMRLHVCGALANNCEQEQSHTVFVAVATIGFSKPFYERFSSDSLKLLYICKIVNVNKSDSEIHSIGHFNSKSAF